MKEKIINIAEAEVNRMEGYNVVTDKQTIFVGIDNVSQCCENWGYVTSQDDMNEFIGSELINIVLVDTALNTRVLDEIPELDSGDIMYVNFNTSKGTFQLIMYNSHNGYYGHKAVVLSATIYHTTVL